FDLPVARVEDALAAASDPDLGRAAGEEIAVVIGLEVDIGHAAQPMRLGPFAGGRDIAGLGRLILAAIVDAKPDAAPVIASDLAPVIRIAAARG
ncbi:hypothetical protein, partial [Rhodovulum sulfidophilum]|uniref:hypothetical protein n=1 Tax=Rhodovulum sulfidophilum TaxID=35806 RepID=UPI0015C03FAC